MDKARIHAKFGKWIEGSRPDDSVAKTARLALRSRLEGVQYFLPLAAERPEEDVEYVHQLRVATRRSMAALKLFRNLLSPSQSRWVQAQLARVRRAAGVARDCDVMRERYGEQGDGDVLQLRQRLDAARVEAQCPIVAVHRRLARPPRFKKRVKKLLKHVRTHPRDMPGRGPVRFDDWARFHFRPIVAKFFRSSPGAQSDLHALHQFRIRGKQLRYGMELLAGAFPAELRDELYPIVEQLQERLGVINDHATGITRLRHWLAEVEELSEVRQLTKVLQQELDDLDRTVADFSDWWTPRFASDFEARFAHVLAG